MDHIVTHTGALWSFFPASKVVSSYLTAFFYYHPYFCILFRLFSILGYSTPVWGASRISRPPLHLYAQLSSVISTLLETFSPDTMLLRPFTVGLACSCCMGLVECKRISFYSERWADRGVFPLLYNISAAEC